MSATVATLPQLTFDTSFGPPITTGTKRYLGGGGSPNYTTFASAVGACTGGDEIEIASTYTETAGLGSPHVINLPFKATNSAWIWIHTSAVSSLPARGTRVASTDASLMPKIINPGNACFALNVENQANHYWLTGIEFKPTTSMTAGNVITHLATIGASAASSIDLPSYIVIDRCYLHGELNVDQPVRGGLYVECNYFSIEDSMLRLMWSPYGHAQALWIAQGAPHKIYNNYIDAATQNFFIGAAYWGGTSTNPDLPSDITFTHNHVKKDPTFLSDDVWSTAAPYIGGVLSPPYYSSLIETKSALRVLIQGNILEQTVTQINLHADWALILKSENDNGSGLDASTYTAINAKCEDITVQYNLIRHTGDAYTTTTPANVPPAHGVICRRHTLKHNLFYSINDVNGGHTALTDGYGNGSWYAFIINCAEDVIFDHNTMVMHHTPINQGGSGWFIYYFHYAGETKRVEITNNIYPMNGYGNKADGGGFTLEGADIILNNTDGRGVVGSTSHHNLIYGNQQTIDQGNYPFGSAYIGTTTNHDIYELHTDNNVGYVGTPIDNNTTAASDFVVQTTSSAHASAADGTDRGADISLVIQNTTGVVEGTTGPPVPPNPIGTIHSGRGMSMLRGMI